MFTARSRATLGNLIGLLFGTGVSQLCALLILVLLAGRLSKENYAIVVTGLSVQPFLQIVGTLGLTMPAIRAIRRSPAAVGEVASGFVQLSLASSVALAVVCTFAVVVLNGNSEESNFLIILFVGNIFASANLSPVFDAIGKQGVAALWSFPVDLLSLAAVWLVTQERTPSLLLIAAILSGKWAATFLLQAVHLLRSGVLEWYPPRKDRLYPLLRPGLPILLAWVVFHVPISGGVLACHWWLTASETAEYGLCIQIATTYLLVAWLAIRMVQPTILGPAGGNPRFRRAVVISCAVGQVLLCSVTYLASLVLIYNVLGGGYEPAIGPLAFVLLAAAFASSTHVATSYLTRQNREALLPALYLAIAALFVGLAAVGSSQWGTVGVSLAAAISTGGGLVAAVMMSQRRRLRTEDHQVSGIEPSGPALREVSPPEVG